MKPLPKYLFLLASFLIFLNAQTRVDPYTQIRQPQIQAGGNGTFFCNFSTTPPTCDTTAFVPTSGTKFGFQLAVVFQLPPAVLVQAVV